MCAAIPSVTAPDGTSGSTQYTLAENDARFTLSDGEERTITVLDGVTCEVTEVDVAPEVNVTVADSDETSVGGTKDGVVTVIAGGDNRVYVTNDYPTYMVFEDGVVLPEEEQDGSTGANAPAGDEEMLTARENSGSTIRDGELARTGGQDMAGWFVLGGVLLIGGASITLMARKRRSNS